MPEGAQGGMADTGSTPANCSPQWSVGGGGGIRIGHGYDLHRLDRLPPAGHGKPFVLGGVALSSPASPTDAGGIDGRGDGGAGGGGTGGGGGGCGGGGGVGGVGPVGHSDGDVLLHAVTDALLGALALPDIGQLFPDSDPRWAGADSWRFVDEAMRLVRSRGWRVANLDCTVILERPKLAPIKDAIRRGIADRLGVDLSCVNVKGKTHEKVDAVGEGRAVEAHAVVLLVRSEAGA